MSDAKYETAVNYFNQASQYTMDQIRYTYDADKNMLIKLHKDAEHHQKETLESATGLAIAGVFAVSSTYEALEKDNWSQHGPDWSLGFMAIFGIGVAYHIANKRRAIKAVERNVSADKASKNNIVM